MRVCKGSLFSKQLDEPGLVSLIEFFRNQFQRSPGLVAGLMDCLFEQISVLEAAVHGQVRLRQGYRKLLTVPGIGKILALSPVSGLASNHYD